MANGFNYRGLGTYLTDLAKKCADARTANAIQKQILYDGADVYADALREASKPYGNLADGIALKQMQQDDGSWYTKLGFNGYDTDGDGKAFALKAAIINSGTSDDRVKGNNFIRKALKAADAKAQAAMDAKYHELMNDMMEV